MKPVHETLEAAKQFLYDPQTNLGGVRYICHAVRVVCDEGLCAFPERNNAERVVLAAVSRLSRNAIYLRTAAIEAGLLRDGCTSRDPAYVEFRNKWLDKLIEENKSGINR